MADGILGLVPSARVGHIGLYRDEATLEPVQYFVKLPSDIAERDVFVLDPMLATGGSAVAALTLLRERGVAHVRLLCILGAPEGVAAVQAAHPDVEIILAALDERLDERGFIVPGPRRRRRSHLRHAVTPHRAARGWCRTSLIARRRSVD
jgi:uracil phosphoribosyltransferase